MKLKHTAFCACLALCAASTAYAQYGLYGSPETLRLSQQNVVSQYAVPAAYADTSAAQTQQASAPAHDRNYQTTTVAYQSRPTAVQQTYPTTAYYQPYQTRPTQTRQPSQVYRQAYQTQQVQYYSNHPSVRRQQSPPVNYRRPTRMSLAQQGQPQIHPTEPIPVPPSAPGDVAPSPIYQQAPVEQYNQHDGRYGSNGEPCGPYNSILGRCERAACGECDTNCGCGCDCDDLCCEGYFCPWYASVSALVLGRSHGRRFWTSYADGDVTDQLTNSEFDMQWKWGGEIRFGRRFCCCCVPYAIEATYWTTEAFSGHRYTTNPGGYVSTPLIVDPMTFGGVAAQNWFDGAEEHRLWRRNEFHNVEANLIREQLAWAYESPWDIGWSVGIRYFRFEEQLTFGSLRQGYSWGGERRRGVFQRPRQQQSVGRAVRLRRSL